MTRRLTTTRLYLEPITDSDTEDWWHAIWSDPEVTRFLPPRRTLPLEHMERLVEKARAEWEAHAFGIWAMREQDSGAFVGHCGLVVNHPPRVELIYALRRESWGAGLVTEAAEAVVSYAGFALGITELDALVFPENAASSRVLEKLGFLPDGTEERFGYELLRYAYSSASRRDLLQ